MAASRPRAGERGLDFRVTAAVIVVIWLGSALVWLSPGFTLPDGAGYYVYLPSIVFDADILFFDEWASFGLVEDGVVRHKEVTRTRFLGNHWTPGSALFWFVPYAAGHLLARAVPFFQNFPANGFSLPYVLAVITATALAGLFALLVAAAIARRYAAPRGVIPAAIGIWFGTPLLWYSLRNPIMPHAVSALAVALVVWLALGWRESADSARLFATGLAAGFAFVVRPQDLVFAVVPLLLLPLRELAGLRWRLLSYPAGVSLAVAPLLVASHFIYGTPLGFAGGSSDARPFASFERVWLWEPLFSWYHGLFTWAPFLLVAVAGLIVLIRSDARMAVAGLATFAAQWAINATMERSFWGAHAFGQRRFLECTVFFLLGAAVLLARLPRWLAAVVTMLTAGWTMALFFASQSVLDLNRYYTLRELLDASWRALGDLRRLFAPLASVPPGFRPEVALGFVVLAALFALAAMLWLRVPLRLRTAVIAVYFGAATVVFATAGFNGRAAQREVAGLIEKNARLARLPGGPDVRFGLLEHEIEYLDKSGRREEARRTRRELEELRQRRDEAIAAMEERAQ